MRSLNSINDLEPLARSLGVNVDSLIALGATRNGRWWQIPERNANGEIVGYALRSDTGEKSFQPGGKRGLTMTWPLPDYAGTSPDDPVVVVEGASCAAAGEDLSFTTVGRPSATGGLEWLRLLLRDLYVVIVGENDDPGRRGAEKIACGLHDVAASVKVIYPPECAKDLREWYTSPAGCSREELLAAIRTADDFSVQASRSQAVLLAESVTVKPEHASPLSFRLDRTPGRVKAGVTALLDGRPIAVETLDLASSNARERFAKAIAAKAPDLDIEAVEAELMQLAAEPSAVLVEDDAPRSRDDLLAVYDELVECELAAMPSGVVEDAEAMLTDPRLVDYILADIAALGVVGERVLALAIYLLGVSRLLAKPLAAILQGPTSSGKSFVIECIARLFPDEATLIATDITPMALYYLPTGRLIHRWVVAGERSRIQNDERAEAARALREMLSSGELRKAVPVKIDGQMQTIVIHQHGPIAYVESTTATRIFDEDANRSLLLSTDESPEQTRRIVTAAAMSAQGDSPDIGPIVARHHALQRILRRVRVVIPFAKRLAAAMPSERPEARRAIGHALDLIRAVAVLHQRQRARGIVQHGDPIQATIADYVVARRLLCAPLGRALGGAVPEAAANLGKRLADHYVSEVFTTTQAAQDDPIIQSRNKMSDYLRTLADASMVELVEAGKGNKPHTWRVIGEVPEGGARWLPTADELEPSLCTTA